MLRNLAGAICALAALAVVQPGQAQAQQRVRYQEFPGSIVHLNNWVVAAKGICQKHGLMCEMIPLATGPLAQSAAAAGSVDLIMSSADVMMQAAANGNDLMILGTQLVNNPYVLAVGAGVLQAPVKFPNSLSALKGKKIGVSGRGSATEMYAKALLTEAGVSSDDVTFLAVGVPATAYAALAVKQVDAALTWDPVPAICYATKACEIAVDMRKGEGPPSMRAMNGGFVVWQARRDYVEKNAATVDRFLAAIYEATLWMQDPKNFPEVLEIAKKNLKLGDAIPEREKVAEQIVRDAIPQFGTKLDRKVVDGFNNFLIANKLIKEPLDKAKIVYRNAP